MSWITNRVVKKVYPSGGWTWSFNEGGYWLTLSLWHKQLAENPVRLWSGFRIWVAPRIGDYFQVSFSIFIRIPIGRSPGYVLDN